MPFVAAQMLSGFLPQKFFMSIFFPLMVAVLFFRRMLRDHEMVLAWSAFIIGALQFYLFIEKGSRYTHANFLWGAQITLFILFAVSIRFLLKQEISLRELARPAKWAAYAAYLPHILSGIAYWVFCYTTPHYG